LRPFPGYDAISIDEWASSSNYHSLQLSVTRRYARGLQIGAAWTWSKAMDYNSADGDTVSVLVPVRVWNYGLSTFDRTHVLKINWLYDVPKTPLRNPVARAALDHWQVSGIASFISGEPLAIGYSFVRAVDITGTPSQGARAYLTGNPVLPKSERTFSRNFRTEVVRPPAVGSIGNAARTDLRGPGVNNFDLAVFKSFPVRERLRLQFRAELYNAFNHTQFSSFDRSARFDVDGSQVNSRLGEFTGARQARVIQLNLRIYY
jgi:hypothetical protein